MRVLSFTKKGTRHIGASDGTFHESRMQEKQKHFENSTSFEFRKKTWPRAVAERGQRTAQKKFVYIESGEKII